MRKISFLVFTFLIIACGKKERDLIVKGNIEGLKKGTVYLKKIQDTILVTVDSVEINGISTFKLQSDLDSPEIFFLDLDKQSAENDRIIFFADKGITEINTTLKRFVFDAKIKGSKQQKLLEDYQTMISKMNNRNLDLIKEQFEAQKNRDSIKFESLVKESNNNLKRKYLFTVNFALNNKDSEVAPYLAISEVYNAQIKYLDTIYNSLTPDVKKSKYGKQLEVFIKEIKENE